MLGEAGFGRALTREDLGYLAHREMRAFAQNALDLGWDLVAYEADARACPPSIWDEGPKSIAFRHWREAEQARLKEILGPDFHKQFEQATQYR